MFLLIYKDFVNPHSLKDTYLYFLSPK